jgi:hypothetical protein
MHAQADVLPDEQYVASQPVESFQDFYGFTRAYIDESYALGEWSKLIGLKWQDDDYTKKQISGEVCRSIKDPVCTYVTDFRYDAIFDVCKDDSDVNCILSLWANLNDGEFIRGEAVERTSPEYKYSFTGDLINGIPNGGTPSLWKFNGIKHQGGELFLLNVLGEKHNVGTGNLSPGGLTAAIQPVSKKLGSFYLPIVSGSKQPDGIGLVWGIDPGKPGNCVRVLSATECALPWPHPERIRYKIELKIGNSSTFSNFLHGRVSQPIVSLKPIDASHSILTVEAAPVLTPFINEWKRNSELSADLNKILDKQFFEGGGYEGNCIDNTRKGCNFSIPPIQLSEFGRNYYLLWLKEFNDTATGVKSMWSIKTLDEKLLWETYGSNECVRKTTDIAGIVTTNANIYASGPPRFNQTTQTLDYEVASPHFNRDGRINLGTYDLVLSTKVARCLYGFSNAPMKAEISVYGDSGEKKVATTLVKQTSDWLYLSASGFEYSTPILKIKLSQEKIDSGQMQLGSQKKMLKCVKGKSIRNIFALNPKCPKGYKKF